jgi:hypothetical protein
VNLKSYILHQGSYPLKAHFPYYRIIVKKNKDDKKASCPMLAMNEVLKSVHLKKIETNFFVTQT